LTWSSGGCCRWPTRPAKSIATRDWRPSAGSADPDALREAWSDGRLDRRTGVDVACLARRGDRWAALDAEGATLADAPVAVIAPGSHPLPLRLSDDMRPGELAAQLGPAGLHRRAGLTTVAALPAGAVPRCTVGGDGHAVPVDATRLLLGPPGTPEDDDADTSDADTADRAWARWAASLAAPPPAPRLLPGRRGERLSTRDHLPLVGPVPDLAAIDTLRRAGAARDDRLALPALDGLWLVGAFGGRGLLWSVLAAELIASRLDGEPAPLERELARRLEPDRFLRQALRRPDTSD
jgi:tRNA 5-methylaminomethyl-2-thiouridine biosynthesis bifunctional protein